jgi:hypothetical protein
MDSARDKAMEKLVGARLRAGLNAGGAECPVAEVLAAFVERSLAPRERASFESHLASCARCQESVAGLVRLIEAETPAAVRSAAPAPLRVARPFWPRWAWAGPALAAVLVAGLWYTGEFRQILRPAGEIARQTASPPAKGPSAPQAPSPEVKQPTSAAAGRDAELKDRLRASQARDMEAARKLPGGKTAASQTETATAQEYALDRAQNEPTLQAKGIVETPAPTAPPPPKPVAVSVPAATAEPAMRAQFAKVQPGEGGGTVQRTRSEMDQLSLHGAGRTAGAQISATPAAGTTKDARNAAPLPSPPPGPPPPPVPAASEAVTEEAKLKESNAREDQKKEQPALRAATETKQENAVAKEKAAANVPGATTQTVEVQAQATSLEIESRSASDVSKLKTQAKYTMPMWRVGPNGLIQQGNSSGKWKKRQSGVKTDLFNVSFPSPSIGWVVGQRGTILRTTDGGNTWLKMPSPTGQDLTQVTATNELAASVTTRNGVTYTTTDGGKTWISSGQ